MEFDKHYDKRLKENNYEVKVWCEEYMNSHHILGSVDNSEIICIRCSDMDFYEFIKLYNLKVFLRDKNGNYILKNYQGDLNE